LTKRIKPTGVATVGTLINPKIDLVEIQHHNHPIFCFKYIQKDYSLEQCSTDEKVAFVEKLFKLSQLSWQEIEHTQKHGLGTEKIAITSISAGLPPIITREVKFLLALRFIGKKPFIGYRDRFLFHVIFIDRNHIVY